MKKLHNDEDDALYFSLFISLIIAAFGIYMLFTVVTKDRSADKILIGNGTDHIVFYDNDCTEADKRKMHRCVPCWYSPDHLCCDRKDIRKWRKLKKN